MYIARDIMTEQVITVSPETPIGEAAKILVGNRINGLPVVDSEGALVGIVCQSDLIAQQRELPLPSVFTLLDGFIPLSSYKSFERQVEKMVAVTVSQAMTANPVTVTPDTSVEEIASLMVKRNIHTLPVTEGGKVIGVVGKEDVLRTLVPELGG